MAKKCPECDKDIEKGKLIINESIENNNPSTIVYACSCGYNDADTIEEKIGLAIQWGIASKDLSLIEAKKLHMKPMFDYFVLNR